MSSHNFRCTAHAVPGQHIRHYSHGSSSDNEEAVIRVAVKRYTPLSNLDPQPGDLTILAGHAAGMPKELYEPLWDKLLSLAQESGKFRIRSVWVVEAYNHGTSAQLNEGLLGDEPSWYDSARDVLAVVNCFRAEMPQPIMGVGHSYAGMILAQVALMHPRLMTAVALLDPPVSGAVMRFVNLPMIALRREQWPSRQEASGFFSKHPVFKAMDPRVLQLFLAHGLVSVEEGSEAVRLATTAAQEASTFAKLCGPNRDDDKTMATDSLGDLDPAIVGNVPYYRPEMYLLHAQLPFLLPSCLYLSVQGSTLISSMPESRKARLDTTGTGIGGSGGVAAGRVREVVMPGSHYFPLETPDLVAEQLHTFIADEMAYFEAKQSASRKKRAAKNAESQDRLSKAYLDQANTMIHEARRAMAQRRDATEMAKRAAKL